MTASISIQTKFDAPSFAWQSKLCSNRAMDDLHFALMRQWNLWDAMLHSSYVAVRMHTYTDKGHKELKNLLAKMGFLLKDCQHDYGASIIWWWTLLLTDLIQYAFRYLYAQ